MTSLPAKKNNDNPPKPLSVSEAARILGVSPSSLRRYESQGSIHSTRSARGHRVFDLHDVLEFKHSLEKRSSYLEKLSVSLGKSGFVKDPVFSKRDKKEVRFRRLAFSLVGIYVLFALGLLTYKLIPKVPLAVESFFYRSPLFTRATDNLATIYDNVLGVRDENTSFELRVSVPTNFDATVTIGEDLTVTGLSSGGITTDTITTGVANVSTLSMTGTATMNNLQAIDDVTETTLEDTLGLAGDVSGVLSDVTVDSLGGVNVGDIEDSDGNVVYIDGGEMVSGDITDLDTESITKIGTIDTGVWNGTIIGPTYGGTGLSSYTTGDIIYASAANTLSQLNIGTTGYVLTAGSSGVPQWADVSATAGPWTLSGTNLYPDLTTYNVGLGTSSPSATLHIKPPDENTLALRVDYAGTSYSANLAEFYNRLGSRTTYFDYDGGITHAGRFRQSYSGGLEISGGAGSASTPSLRRENDNAGIYFPASDTVGLSTSGVERFRINSAGDLNFNSGDIYFENSTGYVGIGLTNPSTPLHVYRNGTGYTATIEQDSTATGVHGLYIDLDSGDNSRYALRIDTQENGKTPLVVTGSGNIGINDITPGAELDIAGDIHQTYANQAANYFYNSATVYAGWDLATTGRDLTIRNVSDNTGGDIVLQPDAETGNVGIATNAPAQKLHVAGGGYFSGNLGIGTTKPVTELTVASTGPIISVMDTNSGGNSARGDLRFLDQTETLLGRVGFASATDGNFEVYNAREADLEFWTNATQQMTIQSDGDVIIENGNLGIGTTNPDALLSLGTSLGHKLKLYDAAEDVGFGIQGSLMEIIGGSANTDFTFGYGTSGSLTRLMTIEGTGNVGIGITTPNQTGHYM